MDKIKTARKLKGILKNEILGKKAIFQDTLKKVAYAVGNAQIKMFQALGRVIVIAIIIINCKK